MMTREDAISVIKEQSEREFGWLKENALRISSYTDVAGDYHPEFVLNFQQPDEKNIEFTSLQFNTKFYMPEAPSLAWINQQNAELRFSRMFWDKDGLVVTMDVYAPNALWHRSIFETNYALFDYVLILVAKMAKK